MQKGLVMEGGAMRGMFTAGVCDFLLENGIEFDGAIGVSAGATFGCNFKSRQIGRAIRYNKKFSRNWKYGSFLSLVLTGDLYNADFCYNQLPNKLDRFDYETYASNPLKFFAVASDCQTGKAVYRELKNCDESDLTWMRASASMPIASRVVKIDGYELLDGGITDSIPLKAIEDLGYQKNLVILTQPRAFVKKPVSAIKIMKLFLHKYPKIYEALKIRHEIYNRQKNYVFEQEKAGKAFVICPETSLGISRTEKNPDELQRVYDLGRLAAQESLPRLQEFLAKE
ncbi:MAG: patatin family protein [Treponema sp.]|nr:patatin family protein [Treponema sp.]